MTALTGKATVTRESRALYRGRPLIVEIATHEIVLREKGRRTRVSVPILAVYDLGFKILAREQRNERLKAKAERTKG